MVSAEGNSDVQVVLSQVWCRADVVTGGSGDLGVIGVRTVLVSDSDADILSIKDTLIRFLESHLPNIHRCTSLVKGPRIVRLTTVQSVAVTHTTMTFGVILHMAWGLVHRELRV